MGSTQPLDQVGVPPSAEESIATLVNIAQLDRPVPWNPYKGVYGVFFLWTPKNLRYFGGWFGGPKNVIPGRICLYGT